MIYKLIVIVFYWLFYKIRKKMNGVIIKMIKALGFVETSGAADAAHSLLSHETWYFGSRL